MHDLENQPDPSLAQDLALAHSLADLASEITFPYFGADISSTTKNDGTPVTQVDLTVEKALRECLAKERPNDSILGEEYGYLKGSGRCWILDPIDGTSEFMAGHEHWGTHIALAENGELLVGVITRPALQRRWWATKNGGAFHGTSLRDAIPIALSAITELSKSKVAIWELSPTKRVQQLKELGIWVEPSLSNMIELLDRQIDAFVDVIGKPWDHAPVALIVKEAGGTFQDHQGGCRIDIGEVRYTNGQIDDAFFSMLALFEGSSS